MTYIESLEILSMIVLVMNSLKGRQAGELGKHERGGKSLQYDLPRNVPLKGVKKSKISTPSLIISRTKSLLS